MMVVEGEVDMRMEWVYVGSDVEGLIGVALSIERYRWWECSDSFHAANRKNTSQSPDYSFCSQWVKSMQCT